MFTIFLPANHRVYWEWHSAYHSWFQNKPGVREELTAEERGRGPPTTALRVKRDSADPALAKGRYAFETI
jgi:hypothetical protein